jgi:hypothetical protein
MIFTNSQGYEYRIRLVGQEGEDPSSGSTTSGSIIKTGRT